MAPQAIKLSGDTNDLPILADYVLLSSTGAYTLTGIVPRYAGQKLLLINTGTNQIILSNENVASQPANRIHILADELLEPDGIVEMEYDALTINRWRKSSQ